MSPLHFFWKRLKRSGFTQQGGHTVDIHFEMAIIMLEMVGGESAYG